MSVRGKFVSFYIASSGYLPLESITIIVLLVKLSLRNIEESQDILRMWINYLVI